MDSDLWNKVLEEDNQFRRQLVDQVCFFHVPVTYALASAQFVRLHTPIGCSTSPAEHPHANSCVVCASSLHVPCAYTLCVHACLVTSALSNAAVVAGELHSPAGVAQP